MRKNDYLIRDSVKDDSDRMFSIWESSVKATHHFLKLSDIQQIGCQVRDYLNSSVFSVATDSTNKVVGFMGMTDNKIDSLFIDPEYFGQGLGTTFVAHASSMHTELFVDVNEDNTQAKIFYEKMNFQVYRRSDLDDEGRPFPILKMIRK